MDESRLATRPGHSSSAHIVRFQLLEQLTPGMTARAWIVRPGADDSHYTKLDGDNSLQITVQSTFNRSFGQGTSQAGEWGWAAFHYDSGYWEVLSMEGSLHRHGKAVTNIPRRTGVGDVTIFYLPSGSSTETTSSITVSVKNLTGTDLHTNDYCFIWYEPFSKQWYAVSGGSGVVTVQIESTSGESAGELEVGIGNGFWNGQIVTVGNGVADLSDPSNYVPGTMVYVAVVNPLTGSQDASHELMCRDRFVGTLNGTATFGAVTRPLVLIRREENYIYHCTLGSPIIAAGARGDVALPDTRVVSAINWSGSNTKPFDKVAVFHDWSSLDWYIIDPTPGSDSSAIVTVDSASAISGCVWNGFVAVPNDTDTYCTDQFPDGDPCLIVVLNADTGSVGTRDALTPGEHYIGRQVGSIDGVPVYAIRTSGGDTVVRFELKEDMVIGQSGVATILTFQSGDWSTEGNEDIEVFDMTDEVWEGFGSNGERRGSRGWARKMADSEAYEIIWMQTPAKFVVYTQTDTDGFTGEVGDFFQGQEPGDKNKFDPTLYKNSMVDSKGIAAWNERDNTYDTLVVDQRALYALGTLGEDMEKGDIFVQLNQNIVPLSPFPFSMQEKNDFTGINSLQQSGKKGDTVLLLWDDGEQKYMPLNFTQKVFLAAVSDDTIDPGYDGNVKLSDATTITVTNETRLTLYKGDVIEVFFNPPKWHTVKDRTRSWLEITDQTRRQQPWDQSTGLNPHSVGKGSIFDSLFGAQQNIHVTPLSFIVAGDQVVFQTDVLTNEFFAFRGAGRAQIVNPPFDSSGVFVPLLLNGNRYEAALIPTSGVGDPSDVQATYLSNARDFVSTCTPFTTGGAGAGSQFGAFKQFLTVQDDRDKQFYLIDPAPGEELLFINSDSVRFEPFDVLVTNAMTTATTPGGDSIAVYSAYLAGKSGSFAPDGGSGGNRPNYIVNGAQDVTPGNTGNAQTGRIKRVSTSSMSDPAARGMGPSPLSVDGAVHLGYPGFITVSRPYTWRDTEDSSLVFGGVTCINVVDEPITKLLVKLTADVANNAATTASGYTIMVSSTQGSESDGGWTTVPTAYNRTGTTIKNNTYCWSNWVNNGWDLTPITAGVPRRFKGSLGGTLTKTTSSITVNSLTALDGGAAPTTVTADNYLHWAGNNTDPCIVTEVLSGSSTSYLLELVSWDLITVTENIVLSSGVMTQTQQAVIGKANAATTNNTVVTFTSTSVVTDVAISGSNLQETKQPIFVINNGGSSNSTIATLSNVNVITNVSLSGTSLIQTNQTIRTITAGGTSNSTIFTGATC